MKVSKVYKRMFTPNDVKDLAKLVAKGITESEAATLLGRTPAQWFSFKCVSKNNDRFKEALEIARAARIQWCFEKIENAADGKGMKQPDWRAADRLLQHTADRFKDQAQPAQIAVGVNVFASSEQARKIAGRVYSEPQKALLEPGETE